MNRGEWNKNTMKYLNSNDPLVKLFGLNEEEAEEQRRVAKEIFGPKE